jgi:hypothetical protein
MTPRQATVFYDWRNGWSLAIGLCSGHSRKAFVGDVPTLWVGCETPAGMPVKLAERLGGVRAPSGPREGVFKAFGALAAR